ncbi:alpha-glucosidase/alpha-galactosidase [Candidatus Poribacteria bacterium]
MAIPIRLGIIGAGSAQFSIGLVRDICLTENLAGSTVCLMDIDEERVDMVHNLATRYVNEMGVDLKFEKTIQREVVLKDADFVCNTASVGAHGGGGYASIHNLRFFLSVAQDMERLCPDAWLIQSGNPVFEGCTLMTRETSTKVLGLCHGHYGVHSMNRVLGLENENVTWQAPGLNHVIYLTHFYYKGEDAYPILDDWIENKAEEYWRTYKPSYGENQMSRAAIQQYKMIGLMPIGDTPRAGGWWFHTSQETKRQWYGPLGGFDSKEGWAIYVASLEKRREQMFRVAEDQGASVTEVFPPNKSGEQIVPIIDALTNDNSGYFQVNIPNNGLIAGIPDDVVVEVSAFVSKRGIQGIQVGRLPDNVMLQIILPRLVQAERRIGLARSPNKGLLLNMILYDHVNFSNRYTPPVASFEEAEKRMVRILENDPELASLI